MADPWLSLNPGFEPGGTVADLVREGPLQEECERIFRVEITKDDPGHRGLTLHRHQRDALDAAKTSQSYVLTTGTGSGKSLAYIEPIVDTVLSERAANGGRRVPGVKAASGRGSGRNECVRPLQSPGPAYPSR